MSSVLRKLRIIAIPLTRPNVSRTLPHSIAKPSRLVYYQFQIALEPPTSIRLASGEKHSDPPNAKKKGWLPEEGVAKWATNKATDTWAGFGKEKSGWKVCSVFFWLKRDDVQMGFWVLAESISRWRADGGRFGF
jgi:hypothetical protein